MSEMTPGGLRPRHLIALRLLADRGPLGQQGLGEALSLDPSNVVGLLNELEDRELIVRRRDRADRRRHIVELSPAGEEEVALSDERAVVVEDRIFAALSADERATLHDLLRRAVGGATLTCEVPGDTIQD
ncbi:MarR family winged helix-turn-helix transcriptional regulator [Streptomyces sp. NPDC026672]|uniref:MarR family winged helix-turn-helix transcriptional regulator n=1 Tax=unclassified Streptomyces TaxID=2593676 RepID=UPI0033EE4049